MKIIFSALTLTAVHCWFMISNLESSGSEARIFVERVANVEHILFNSNPSGEYIQVEVPIGVLRSAKKFEEKEKYGFSKPESPKSKPEKADMKNPAVEKSSGDKLAAAKSDVKKLEKEKSDLEKLKVEKSNVEKPGGENLGAENVGPTVPFIPEEYDTKFDHIFDSADIRFMLYDIEEGQVVFPPHLQPREFTHGLERRILLPEPESPRSKLVGKLIKFNEYVFFFAKNMACQALLRDSKVLEECLRNDFFFLHHPEFGKGKMKKNVLDALKERIQDFDHTIVIAITELKDKVVEDIDF